VDHEKQMDPELHAMSAIVSVLTGLDDAARRRVLNWVAEKSGISLADIPSATPRNVNGAEIGPKKEGTLSQLAARLGVESCRDLLLAAALHLVEYQGKERFAKDDWVSCAREAKQWKSAYSVQTATVINRLMDSGSVNETSKGTFSLTDETISKMSAQLDQSQRKGN